MPLNGYSTTEYLYFNYEIVTLSDYALLSQVFNQRSSVNRALKPCHTVDNILNYVCVRACARVRFPAGNSARRRAAVSVHVQRTQAAGASQSHGRRSRR